MKPFPATCTILAVLSLAGPAPAQEVHQEAQAEPPPEQPDPAPDQTQEAQPRTSEQIPVQEPEQPPKPPPAEPPPVAPGVLNRNIDRALASLAHEPSLAELQREALRLADADIGPTRNWLRAPNLAALLPVLKVVAEHDMERDESLDRYQDEPDRWGADTDKDLGFQISAQWQLGELIFNPDEVRVYNALANRASRREALLTLLTGYYYERRRLQVYAKISPPSDLVKMVELRLKIEELTAMIDALTGGLLTSNLNKKEVD